MDMEDINEKIIHYSRQLRLPGFRKHYQSLQEEMPAESADYNAYLGRLLEIEYQERIERRKKIRIKLAGFPQLKYLQDLSLDDLPQDAREKLPALKSMDFIASGQNIILSGNHAQRDGLEPLRIVLKSTTWLYATSSDTSLLTRRVLSCFLRTSRYEPVRRLP